MNNTNPLCSLSISPCPPLETYFFGFTHDAFYLFYINSIVVLNCIMALLTVASNSLVIYTIIMTTTLHTPTNALIVGLAVSDFGVGMVSQPCFCVLRIAELQFDADLFCRYATIFQGSVWMLATVSMLTYTAIAGDRYMAVYLHLRYKEVVTNKKISAIMLVIWAFSTTVAVLRFKIAITISLSIATVIFTGLLIANIFFIVKISMVIRRHSRQIHAQEQSTQPGMNMPRYKKSVNTMYYVIGAFVLCYVPMFTSLVIQSFMDQEKYRNSRDLFCLQLMGSTFVMFNGVLYPIIYYWRIKELRTGTVTVLKKLWLRDNNALDPSLEPTVRLSLRRHGDRDDITVHPKVSVHRK